MTAREKSALKERIDYYWRMGSRFIESDDLDDVRKAARYYAKANALHEFYVAADSDFECEDFCEDFD